MNIDWRILHSTAIDAMKTAYAPYSKFPVGVAGFAEDGRLLSGCNVENASYGLTLCAECGLISNLIATGGGKLVAIYCVDQRGEALMPCGRCRQLLFEHGGGSLAVMTASGVQPLSELLPWAFGPDELSRRHD
ncbi:MAG: cytidine deaminase [Actinomycetota bacterium]